MLPKRVCIQVTNLCVVIVTEALNQSLRMSCSSKQFLYRLPEECHHNTVTANQKPNRCHLIVGVPALGHDVVGVDAGVADGDQAPAPHLALHHVQQEAELALLAPAVAAAPSGRGENNQLELFLVCPQPYVTLDKIMMHVKNIRHQSLHFLLVKSGLFSFNRCRL